METSEIVTDAASGLLKMRGAFPAHHISKLPKESRKQIDERNNRVAGCMVWNCTICGASHHKDAVHLDYVGHAALTDRLLDADLLWSWEPLSFGEDGLPLFDRTNGLWIKLTVQGVTRMGYGSADGKSGGDAIKEIIGDALRNAAMRFGAALDLWHKGDLHIDEPEEVKADAVEEAPKEKPKREPLKGPIKTRAKLREAAGDIVKELEQAVDGGDISYVNAVLDAWAPAIQQIREEGPADWWSAPEWGLNAKIEWALEAVKEPAE